MAVAYKMPAENEKNHKRPLSEQPINTLAFETEISGHNDKPHCAVLTAFIIVQCSMRALHFSRI
jgi:hypothetical protein